MNKEEILAMKASVTLDGLIAEDVMGWEYNEMSGYKEGCYVMDKAEGTLVFISDWKPSSNIAQAWEVVEKLRETHCYKIYDYGRNMHKEEPHQVTFSPSDKGWEHSNEARASTLPLAICKAALLAVMDS